MTDAASGQETLAFDLLGGEARVRELADRFYDLMDLEPAFAELRALHPPSLEGSRDKLFWFLCGWLGGPSHYIERFGHPRLRARHLPFEIGTGSATSGCAAWPWRCRTSASTTPCRCG